MTYAERLAWLNREVDKAFDALQGFLAERKGAIDADGGAYEGLGKHLEKYRQRYDLGLSDGKTLLLVERSDRAATTDAPRS